MSQTTYRNRHDRLEHHYGDLPATLVELAEAIGIYPAGSTLEDTIRLIDLRLSRLENEELSFKGDSVFLRSTADSFVASSALRRSSMSSLLADAIARISKTFGGIATRYDFLSGISGWSEENWADYSNVAQITWASGDGALALGSLEVDFAGVGDVAALGLVNGSLTAGATYRLTFSIKRVSGSGNLQWGLGSRSSSSSRGTASNQSYTSSFVTKTLYYTPSVTVTDPVIWICSWGTTTQVARVDDVSVLQVSPAVDSDGTSMDAVLWKSMGGSFVAGSAIGTPLEMSDDKASAASISAPSVGNTTYVRGDAPSWTIDATDPAEILVWASDGVGSYTGWLKLVVSTPGTFRIHTSGSGMKDTIMAIWGPSGTPPGASDPPYHLSDDGVVDSVRSSLHDVGTDPDGTDFIDGDAYSEDDQASGIALSAGTWWICVWPYSDTTWDVSEGQVIVTIEAI